MPIEDVAPARERGLKWAGLQAMRAGRCVAPARERGLKYQYEETKKKIPKVAPARERGLKWRCCVPAQAVTSRSREGAWIEIICFLSEKLTLRRRSREGAWIEIGIAGI